ncbi:MAG: rhodanese-like domain-containing protein [Phycisphaerae bacterium]|nr:rhodanese-like domain-containing protein [Phycisphaerae bacterium]
MAFPPNFATACFSNVLGSKFHGLINRSFVASVLIGAACVGGCTTNVVDPHVMWAETTSDALDLMSKPRGTFGLSGPPNSAWVDPRTESAFEAGHIPGAINLPFERLEAEHVVAFKGIDVIVIYDVDYDSAVQMAYAKRLIALGYKAENVVCLRGGLKAWKRDGNAIATGKGADATTAAR